MKTKFFSAFTILLVIGATLSIAFIAYMASNDKIYSTMEYIDSKYLDSRFSAYYKDTSNANGNPSPNTRIPNAVAGNQPIQEPLTYFKITEVPRINQHPELPTGCEVTSAAIALNYLGINVSKIDLANTIVKSPLPANGVGSHPNEAFIGSPYDKNGYGVFHSPVFNLMRGYTDKVQDVTGISFEDLLSHIAAGHPAIVWTTTNLDEFEYTDTWSVNDIPFTWPGNEHTSVLIGYSSNQVIVNDPYTGLEKTFDKATFKARFEALGHQAIIVIK
ncbi:C39 family peptidase [Clostridium cellulovorans]|uniref:Peptidase C39-like domain-containing protein n=1 Tax=Clostridium cellulovorans (strain ATCC 35296 / DSM 3052 / OCM 3 / 743B) TaxID=573061 RepID=D9SUE0_CLOC7|nr:C39 family peptidase [Clostridium cellulovorans]ADL52895.1 hypothetical protein Clocel_3209 [Clostridium cellulovorans 743B]